MWDEKTLQAMIRDKLGDSPLIVVSNREPYVHRRDKRGITCMRASGGLVTALDPVLTACNGIWVAHGSGNADRYAVDENNEVQVPPDKPSYTLHRLWISKEEENGFYYGYSNEALWPLCHIAYTRPDFRKDDWRNYVRMNQRFADTVIDTIDRHHLQKPFVFIQDYHLTMLPRFLKARRPDIMTAHFWHIPWPNAEVFRICSQRREILEGLLANDIMAFHIKYHCDNFMDSVANELETRIDRENSAVVYGGATTLVRSFPISIDYEMTSRLAASVNTDEYANRISDEIGFPYEVLAIGIDRIDYTKGIIERLKAIDRFLEKYPRYQKRFVYLGYGVMTRIHLNSYKNLNDEITRYVTDINYRYRSDNWEPIVFRRAELNYRDMIACYRMANLCIVSSLHDGMNLVAKEFIASQIDNRGMLVLSQFTGSSRELSDALLVNPYDIEAMSDAIRDALEMPVDERVRRMEKMKEVIRENNIYKWVAKIVQSLTKL
jgi:trehalose 6-phosphate synthase